MKIIKQLCWCLAAMWLVASCAGNQTDKSAFVQHEGTKLVVNGKDYKFKGTNFWYGAILGSEGQGGNRERLCAELDSLHALGIDNLRVLVGSDGARGEQDKVEPTLQEAPGQYNDTILAGLDFLLSEMGKRDMKAVLYLNNSWEWSGGFGYYLEQVGKGKTPLPNSAGYDAYVDHVAMFAANDSAHQLFYDYVRYILGRTNRYTNKAYVDDPAIMAWQIGNEPRPFGKGDENFEPFVKWLSETSALIRSLDKNHLISVGGEGFVGCDGDTTLFRKISSDPNIDYITIHMWPTHWGWARKDSCEADVENACAESMKYAMAHVAIAKELGKPVVIEEFGYPRDGFSFSPDATTAARDRYYDFVLDMVANEPVLAGCNFWAWGGLPHPLHERWQPGDPYLGDPAQEPQGLFCVFMSDTSTIQILCKY